MNNEEMLKNMLKLVLDLLDDENFIVQPSTVGNDFEKSLNNYYCYLAEKSDMKKKLQVIRG